MTQVYVKYNPYRLETVIKVNGQDIPNDSILYKITKGKRLQEWISKFPKMLREELNTTELSLEFYGMALDWDDFEDAFEQAEKKGIIKVTNKRYSASRDDEDITEKIIGAFHDLQNGPIDDFRDPKLKKAFDNINNTVFRFVSQNERKIRQIAKTMRINQNSHKNFTLFLKNLFEISHKYATMLI